MICSLKASIFKKNVSIAKLFSCSSILKILCKTIVKDERCLKKELAAKSKPDLGELSREIGRKLKVQISKNSN